MPVKIFDADFYRSANPGLQGLSDDLLWSHFQDYGLEAGLSFSPVVNLNFYRASNSDLRGYSNTFLFEHLQVYGISEGRQFSELWDLNFYRRNNADLAGFRNEQLFQHLQDYGIAEGRQFSQFFDVNYYRANNLDLITAFSADKSATLQHFVIHGLEEGRRFSVAFDSNFYRRNHPDLAAANFNNQQLLEHFRRYGLSEGRASSESFDVRHYLDSNLDLQQHGFNNQMVYEHFTIHGLKEGRIASNYIVEDSVGNTLDHSRNIFIDHNSVIWRDAVGNNDRTDIYRFTLDNPSNEFNMKLNGLNNDVGVKLLDSNGKLVANSKNPGTSAESLTVNNLATGTFYLEVYLEAESGYTNYNLSLSVNSITETPIPRDTKNDFINRVLELTNQERTQAGLKPLVLDEKLSNVSQKHSEDMANNDFFSHTGSNGSSAVQRAQAEGYIYPYVGENIAAGYSTPEAVIAAWMNSPGHRKNILNPYYQEIGIGYYHLKNDTGNINYIDYWTQNFSTGITS